MMWPCVTTFTTSWQNACSSWPLQKRKKARHIDFLPLGDRDGFEEDAVMRHPSNAGASGVPDSYYARAAFTLVELLVIVAILGVLAVLLFPTIQSSIASGDRAACLNNLKTLHAGVTLFAADRDGQILSANAGRDGTLPQFRVDIHPYLSPGAASAKDEGYFYCRAALRARKVNFSESTITYGYNGSLGYPNYTPPRLMRLNEILNPSKTMMIMDGRYANPTIWNFAVGPGNNRRPQPEDFVHSGKVNVVYVDGHVSALEPGDLPTDSNDVFWDAKGTVP